MTTLQGRTAIVTGAGQGIGAALTRALHAAGAKTVITDLDTPQLAAIAAETGAHAIPGDLTSPEFCRTFARQAHTHLKTINYCFSNAGTDTGTGTDAPDNSWQLAIDLNLMAHVRLMREIIPIWTADKQGHLVITASAAGLLAMVGNAPYSVTKHAAVAYAEWLVTEHAHQGIRVQALCPQGVNTRMLRNAGPAEPILSADGTLEPEQVAQYVLEHLDSPEFLLLPHEKVAGYYQHRASNTTRWLQTMNKLRQSIPGI